MYLKPYGNLSCHKNWMLSKAKFLIPAIFSARFIYGLARRTKRKWDYTIMVINAEMVANNKYYKNWTNKTNVYNNDVNLLWSETM